jgi:hypothetical protein
MTLVSMVVQRMTAPRAQRMTATAIVSTIIGTIVLLALVVLFRRRGARRAAASRAARVAAGLPEDTMEFAALTAAQSAPMTPAVRQEVPLAQPEQPPAGAADVPVASVQPTLVRPPQEPSPTAPRGTSSGSDR